MKKTILFLALTISLGLPLHAQTSVYSYISEVSTACAGGTTNGKVKLHLSSSTGQAPSGATLTVTGSFSATLAFEQSADNGTTFVAISGNPQPSGTAATTTTTTGVWTFSVSGRTDLCVRASSYSSGPIRIVINTSAAALSTGGGAASSAAFSAITSGTNTTAAMVVGSGASIATSGSGTIAATSAPFSGITASTNTTSAMVVGSGASIAPTGTGTITATSLIVPTLISTSGPVSDPGGYQYYQFNNAAGALTFNAPAGVVGYQRCYRNATTRSGVITIQMATSNTVDVNGANGSSAGTLVSGGALGDAACIVCDLANHWYGYVQSGIWTNN